MTGSAPSQNHSFATWAWRLLPLFGLIAAAVVWNVWSTAEEDEMAIRSALQTHAAEWDYVKRITGKSLSK